MSNVDDLKERVMMAEEVIVRLQEAEAALERKLRMISDLVQTLGPMARSHVKRQVLERALQGVREILDLEDPA